MVKLNLDKIQYKAFKAFNNCTEDLDGFFWVWLFPHATIGLDDISLGLLFTVWLMCVISWKLSIHEIFHIEISFISHLSKLLLKCFSYYKETHNSSIFVEPGDSHQRNHKHYAHLAPTSQDCLPS